MDRHEGRFRGRDRKDHRRSHGRSGSQFFPATDSQHYRPRVTDPGSASHEGQEHLDSREKCQDGNNPRDLSSCANVAINPIMQNSVDSFADNGTTGHIKQDMSSWQSSIKAPETCQASRRLPNHMDRNRSQGRGFYRVDPDRSGGCRSSPPASQHHRPFVPDPGSSSHGGREHLNHGEKRRDGNSPSEPLSCVSMERNQIRENRADLFADQGEMYQLRTGGLSSIKEPETSSTPSNSSADSQPFMGHTDHHGGQGQGWQSFTNTLQRFPRGSTDPRLSSQRGQERVKIGGNDRNEPSSCASADSNPISKNPAADVVCRFANLDMSPDRSSIRGRGAPGIDGKSDSSKQTFDICPIKKTKIVLQPSLLDKNREKRKELQRTVERSNSHVLRKGMILLKGYLSLYDQIKIVKQCRNLGVGVGGFYQPGYRDGGELQLKMMCLGKNWDPETKSYGDHRPSDDAKPPVIPTEFFQFVERAIKDSHSLIEEMHGVGSAKQHLPWMTPDVCIVNFYSSSGRLGIHQDRDESERSLRLELPVVSFSIGDTAEFLYGNQRDVNEADVVDLESGDVLIFGGESRKVFHGVKSIKPDTAPKSLISESNLRPGRLNLTFRQY